MAPHVFNVPKPYKEKGPEKSKFRFFGHSLRLGSSKSAPPPASRRTHSSCKTNDDAFGPTESPRPSSFSSPPPYTRKGLTVDLDDDSSSSAILKFGLLKRRIISPRSLRSSTASTASTSTTLSDDLSPPSSVASTPSSVDDDLGSPLETRRPLCDDMDADATWVDDAHVLRHYASLNWRVVRIQGDGNCLFRAVSDQIYRNEAFYGDIRRRVIEYIEREKELFRPFVENEQQGVFEPIHDYCKRMKQDAQWGGNPELYAVARLFNVHIVVHQGPMRRLRIENDSSESPAMELNLLFRKDHYDSLHDETQLNNVPRLSTTVALANDAVEENVQPQVVVEEAKVETKKKKKKGVVFIGEQTRVERVEVEPVEVTVQVPSRFVVRRGKVWNPEEAPLDEDDSVDTDSLQTLSICGSEEWPASEPVSEPVSPPPSNNQPERELPVARVKRVNFKRGRRVEA